MTVAEQSNGHDGLPDRQLVVLHVTETIESALAGHEGCTYESPPQPREQALVLVQLLLGHPGEPADFVWSCPVAGGRRTVTLTTAAERRQAMTGEGEE